MWCRFNRVLTRRLGREDNCVPTVAAIQDELGPCFVLLIEEEGALRREVVGASHALPASRVVLLHVVSLGQRGGESDDFRRVGAQAVGSFS